MTNLEQVIEEKKKDFIVDNDELERRIESRLISYKNVLPPINDDTILSIRERKYYRTLQSLLIDSTAKLSGDYTLDNTHSKIANGVFTITYIKNSTLQKKDLTAIKKQIKLEYEAELEVKKAQYIQKLTQQQAAEAQAAAEQQAADNTKALQQELSNLLSSK
jgi:hypothetical protein